MQTRKDKKLLLCEERASRLPPGFSGCAAKMKGNRGNENQNKGDPKQCPKMGDAFRLPFHAAPCPAVSKMDSPFNSLQCYANADADANVDADADANADADAYAVADADADANVENADAYDVDAK